MSSTVFIEWAKRAFDEEVRSGFSRASSFDGISATSCLEAIRAQPRVRLDILKDLLPCGVGFNVPDGEAKRSKLPPMEAEAVERYLEDLRKIERASFIALMNERARTNWLISTEYKTLYKQAKKDFSRISRALSKELDAELHSCGSREAGLVMNRDWGRMVVSLGLTHQVEFEYAMGFESRDGLVWLDRSDYLVALGIGRGSWSLATKDNIWETFVRGSELIKWHVGEYRRLIVNGGTNRDNG